MRLLPAQAKFQFYQFVAVIKISIVLTSMIMQQTLQANSYPLFDNNQNLHVYKEALTQMRNNNKEAVEDFFDDLFLTFVDHNPQLLTKLRIFESSNIREHNAHLNNVSPEIFIH